MVITIIKDFQKTHYYVWNILTKVIKFSLCKDSNSYNSCGNDMESC